MSGSKAYKDLTLRISTDGASFKAGMRDINRDLAKFRSEFQRTMKNLKVKFEYVFCFVLLAKTKT